MRQPGVPGQLGPVLAAIGALVERAPGPAGGKRVRVPERLPERGVEHVRIRRVDDEIARAGRIVAHEHLSPRRAAIGRLVDATLLIRSPEGALRGDPDDVGVRGVDAHAADLARSLEAQELPGFPRRPWSCRPPRRARRCRGSRTRRCRRRPRRGCSRSRRCSRSCRQNALSDAGVQVIPPSVLL